MKRKHNDLDDAMALNRLEEMWDRQILKGDDEFLEAKVASESEVRKDQQQEKRHHIKLVKRRSRKM